MMRASHIRLKKSLKRRDEHRKLIREQKAQARAQKTIEKSIVFLAFIVIVGAVVSYFLPI